jgi:hypothetical protein
MMNYNNIVAKGSLLLIVISLSSCGMLEDNYYNLWGDNPSYTSRYGNYHYNPANPSSSHAGTGKRPRSRGVRVPESYHFAEQATPVSHKDRDKQWVDTQNPNAYTIELNSGEKPAEVANTLYKAPTGTRKAQIKQQKDGKTVYKGVYGSFENEEEARKALDSLPEDVRSKAKVERWNDVQSKTGAGKPAPVTNTTPDDTAY